MIIELRECFEQHVCGEHPMAFRGLDKNAYGDYSLDITQARWLAWVRYVELFTSCSDSRLLAWDGLSECLCEFVKSLDEAGMLAIK